MRSPTRTVVNDRSLRRREDRRYPRRREIMFGMLKSAVLCGGVVVGSLFGAAPQAEAGGWGVSFYSAAPVGYYGGGYGGYGGGFGAYPMYGAFPGYGGFGGYSVGYRSFYPSYGYGGYRQSFYGGNPYHRHCR